MLISTSTRPNVLAACAMIAATLLLGPGLHRAGGLEAKVVVCAQGKADNVDPDRLRPEVQRAAAAAAAATADHHDPVIEPRHRIEQLRQMFPYYTIEDATPFATSLERRNTGVVLGYNFGDGHFHDHRLLAAIEMVADPARARTAYLRELAGLELERANVDPEARPVDLATEEEGDHQQQVDPGADCGRQRKADLGNGRFLNPILAGERK